MIYKIRTYGDPILREVAKDVEKFDDDIKVLLEDMLETMYATDGVGLAAPQIGISKRIFVCDDGNGNIRKVINPFITPISDKTQEFEEGCLSVPGIYKKVQRPYAINIKYSNENGESVEENIEGFLAVIMQHEFDHLNATLFVDRVSPMAKRMINSKLKELRKETLKEMV